MIDLGEAIYLTPNLGWLGYIVGGFLFGVGMTLASGCGQRTLVRVGGGNLKSLVVLLLLGLTAYMTMRGLPALFRVEVVEATNFNLPPQFRQHPGRRGDRAHHSRWLVRDRRRRLR